MFATQNYFGDLSLETRRNLYKNSPSVKSYCDDCDNHPCLWRQYGDDCIDRAFQSNAVKDGVDMSQL